MNDRTEPLRIVIVDDHAVLRSALARLLRDQEAIELVGEAGDVRGALETVEVKRPDLVLLDIDLGSDNALDILPQMLSHAHKPRVLILSMHDDPEHVQAAFAAGAQGYLLKEAGEEDLLDAIRTLARGERYVHPSLGAKLAQAALGLPTDPLTDRERDTVRLLALGHTNQEVADLLFLSVRTVETHRAHAIAKLRLATRADLVAWALDAGLIGQSNR
ncbi:MAG: two component transcriptional regulator, LuxR family [Thermoleophilia bacterium]|nr:two component transcriptional regulator, LuxR family [Thermoleophilia bacterium]MCZ4496051.1 two component transcriptional regulator, LuxR family [Thermoleophilia bacterium]